MDDDRWLLAVLPLAAASLRRRQRPVTDPEVDERERVELMTSWVDRLHSGEALSEDDRWKAQTFEHILNRAYARQDAL